MLTEPTTGRAQDRCSRANHAPRLDSRPTYRLYQLKAGKLQTLKEFSVKSGEQLELGDVEITGDKRPEPVRTKAGGGEPTGSKPPQAGTQQAKQESTAMPPQRKTVVTGKVTLAGGKPAAAAHVAVIGIRNQPFPADDSSSQVEVLADGTADNKGNYRLSVNAVEAISHTYANVIARLDGYAIAWQQLNLDSDTAEAPLTLAPEELIRGRLVSIEGQAAAGVRLSVGAVTRKPGYDFFSSKQHINYSLPGGDNIPAPWFGPVTADAEGLYSGRHRDRRQSFSQCRRYRPIWAAEHRAKYGHARQAWRRRDGISCRCQKRQARRRNRPAARSGPMVRGHGDVPGHRPAGRRMPG